MAAAKGLKPKYKAFAEAYLKNGGNAYQAALTAGYSEAFARARSYELPDRPEIAEYIARRRQQMAKRAVTPERVLLELANIGFGQKDYPAADASGRVHERPPDLGARLKALELMGKNLGLFERGAAGGNLEGVTIVDDITE